MTNYRKIYKQCYGSIPEGYEIHHIDGDHSNNHPSNLKALPGQEHYDIHWKQGDYAACLRIAARLGKSPKELSEISKKTQQERIKNGTHHFLGERNPSHKRVKDGTHHFFDREWSRQKALKQRTWEKQFINGNHPSQIFRTCSCGRTGKGGGMVKHINKCEGEN